MKSKGHPKYNKQVTIKCISCGTTFKAGSTRDEITVELCSHCHPFYTGKDLLVDTDNTIEKFQARMKASDATKVAKKRKKRAARKQARGTEYSPTPNVTLKDMLKQVKS